MKCDLHVHSYFSGLCTTPLVRKFCRESYSDPREVYAALKERGMNLVTLTEHDSIESAEALRRYNDFFVSEEVTCRMPSGTEVHVGVYDLSERQHVQIQQRRNDVISLLVYLTEKRLFFCVNHVFSSLTGSRQEEDFEWFREYFPAIETHNAQMLESANLHAALLARQWRKVGIGGSDAHTLPSVGMAYTEVPGARDKDEFFAGLRDGMGRVSGESGSCRKLTRDLFLITAGLMREKAWTVLLAPLATLLPVAALLNYWSEDSFNRHWAARVLGQPETAGTLSGMAVPQPAMEEAI
jgi:predicted metal-dependent phosphoesterase TrpH